MGLEPSGGSNVMETTFLSNPVANRLHSYNDELLETPIEGGLRGWNPELVGERCAALVLRGKDH